MTARRSLAPVAGEGIDIGIGRRAAAAAYGGPVGQVLMGCFSTAGAGQPDGRRGGPGLASCYCHR